MKLESLEEKQTNSSLNEKDPPGQFIGYPESKVERQRGSIQIPPTHLKNQSNLEMILRRRSDTGPLMLTQLIYMDYFTHLEFLLAAA